MTQKRARSLLARAALLTALVAQNAHAEAQERPGEAAAKAGEEPDLALTIPQLSKGPTITAFEGKPIKRVEVTTVGSRWASSPRIKNVVPGEPFTPEAARRAMRELSQNGEFARIFAEAAIESDGIILRLIALPRRLIASIRMSGATLDRTTTLETAHLREGGEITEPMLADISARIRSYYADHGYPQARVTTDVSDTDDPFRVVLRIEINAGEPRTVTRRYFVLAPLMEREVGSLKERYKLGIGARIDEPLLEEADRELSEDLKQNGFFHAEVKHVVKLSDHNSDLFVYISPGPRIVPVFQGNRSVDEVELQAAIAPSKGVDAKTQDLIDKLTRLYIERGFLDANIKVEERGGPNDPVHKMVFQIDEGDQIRVTKRSFVCAPKDWNKAQSFEEIDSFLIEELPGETDLAIKDPNVVDKLFGAGDVRNPRAIPLLLSPTATYAPETYKRAIKHLKDLAYSKGYLNAVIGPVIPLRATCDPRSPAGRCIPEKREPFVEQCAVDALGLPQPIPEPKTSLTCHPDPLKHIECAREIELQIPLHLGPQTLLYDIAFDGARLFSEKRLFEIAELPLGSPMSTVALEAARTRVLDAYRDRGFAYAEVHTSIEPSPDQTRARARFTITEHDQVSITSFVVHGATRTSEELILKRLTLEAGKPFVEREARRSEERISALGTFSSVSVGLEDPDVPQKQKRVIVTVSEQMPQYLDPRAGFSTGEGLRFAVEYGNKNIAGLAISLTLRVQLAYLFDFVVLDPGVRRDYEKLSVGQQLERRNTVSVTLPEIGLGPLVSLSMDGIDVRDNQRGFGIVRQAFLPTLTYRPRRDLVGRLGASVEFNEVDIFNPDAAASTNIDAIYRVPYGSTVAFSQRISATWDGRNNPFAATRGALLAAGVEHVNAFPVGSINNPAKDTSHFLRLTGRIAGYVELNKKGAALAMSLASGYNLQLNDASKTYPDRFFFLGGVDTIRSFLTDALVPQDRTKEIYESGRTSRSEVIKDVPVRGGNFSINPRIELRLPFGDTFQTGIFLDTGNLWIDPKAAASSFRLRYALGAGLRINTPVGPLALDYGINLDRREWEDFGALHFAIGLF